MRTRHEPTVASRTQRYSRRGVLQQPLGAFNIAPLDGIAGKYLLIDDVAVGHERSRHLLRVGILQIVLGGAHRSDERTRENQREITAHTLLEPLFPPFDAIVVVHITGRAQSLVV